MRDLDKSFLHLFLAPIHYYLFLLQDSRRSNSNHATSSTKLEDSEADNTLPSTCSILFEEPQEVLFIYYPFLNLTCLIFSDRYIVDATTNARRSRQDAVDVWRTLE